MPIEIHRSVELKPGPAKTELWDRDWWGDVESVEIICKCGNILHFFDFSQTRVCSTCNQTWHFEAVIVAPGITDVEEV